MLERVPEFTGVLVPVQSIVFGCERSVEMVVDDGKVTSAPSPGRIPLRVPRVVYVQRQIGPADPAQVGEGGLVPALNVVVVGGLIQQLESDNVRDGSEEGGEEAQGEGGGAEVGIGGKELGLAGRVAAVRLWG